MKVYDLIFKHALDGTITLEWESTEHSHVRFSKSTSLWEEMKSATGESEKIYKIGDSVINYNSNYIYTESVYFRAPSATSLYHKEVFVGLNKDAFICSQSRKTNDPKYDDRRRPAREYILAFRGLGIDISNTKIFDRVSDVGSYGEVADEYNRFPLTDSEILVRLREEQFFSRKGYIHNLQMLTEQERLELDRFFETPEKFVVNEGGMTFEKRSFTADDTTPIAEVKDEVISQEFIDGIHKIPFRDNNDMVRVLATFFAKYSYLGSKNKQLVLVMYKFLAGLDDYDARNSLREALRNSNGNRSFREDLETILLTMLSITNYATTNNTHNYTRYPASYEESIGNLMSDYDITYEDLVVPELQSETLSAMREQLETENVHTLFSMELVAR